MTEARDPMDPKGLIREAYRIEGITAPECRSIFLDWALSLPEGVANPDAIRAMLDRYGEAAPKHPMSVTLREGLARPARTGRRGGRAGRFDG